MLINLFDVEGRKIIPGQACYLIPWLKKIMDEFPEDYIQVYSYIFFSACPDATINPYVNINEEDRENIILLDLKPIKFSLESPTVLYALERCIQLYETATFRIWKGAKIMLDQMADDLRTKKLIYGKDGNAADLRGIMDKLPVYTKNFMELEKLLKEEQSKVKGDRVIPYWQKDGYRETKSYDNDDKEEAK
jgi:hypothetical protein